MQEALYRLKESDTFVRAENTNFVSLKDKFKFFGANPEPKHLVFLWSNYYRRSLFILGDNQGYLRKIFLNHHTDKFKGFDLCLAYCRVDLLGVLTG